MRGSRMVSDTTNAAAQTTAIYQPNTHSAPACFNCSATNSAAHGLRFRGAWYLSDEMLARGWLEKGRSKPFKVRISFDPRHAGSVYLHMEGTEFGYEVCRLNGARSRAFADPFNEPSFWDIDLEEFDRKCMLADAREREGLGAVEMIDAVKHIAVRALERQAGRKRKLSLDPSSRRS